MVQVIGWTPSSHKPDPGTSLLNQFVIPFEAVDEKDSDYPLARSGHRCFTDNDYFYVIGGYTNSIRKGSIFKELWAMNLVTLEWRRYVAKGDLPDHLASFTIVQTYPYSKTFILFGGSGTTFGTSSSNDFYILRANNEDCSIECQKLNVEGVTPQPVYGHAMCAGEIPGKYYIIGGTEGVTFNFDVFALTMKTKPNTKGEDEQLTWHCELISHNTLFIGRYRLEATYDEKNECLVFFGGGNNDEVFGFESMIVLNVKTKESKELDTIPDAQFGFPSVRRCHTIVRLGRNVIMTGGVNHSIEPAEPSVKSDVWIFNLDDYSWRKYEHPLPKPVFFHDSVLTEDGWFLSFGGVDGIAPKSKRNNTLRGAWFGVPSLQRFALETLRKECPNKFSGLYCGNIRLSQVFEVFNLFCKKGTIEEKERELIENGQLKFHEKENRTRFFMNEDAMDFVVKHRVEGVAPVARRRERGMIRMDAEPGNERNRGIQLRIQRVIERLFRNRRDQNHPVVDEDNDDEEESEEGEEDEEEQDEDEDRRNFEEDDDFENGRFNLIPMQQPLRREPQ